MLASWSWPFALIHDQVGRAPRRRAEDTSRRFTARSLLRIDGPSVAERGRAGCKEQRSAEYWMYSSERRRRRRPGSARHATPGGYAQQAPRQARRLCLVFA